MKKIRAKLIFPLQDTSIELKIQDLLSKLHIEFYTHKYISEINHGYQCDIFIPKQETEGIVVTKNTIIECDGCYWHGCPLCKKEVYKNYKQIRGLDKIRTKELLENGFNVIRLWEHEIKNMKLSHFKRKLKENILLKKENKITEEQFNSRIVGWKGYANFGNNYNLMNRLKIT